MVKYLKKIKAIHIILILFFLINLALLTAFPFVHSDEAWLSGLSRNMLKEKSPAVTEPFFDLYPRHPHAVKIIFHLLQIPFLKLMGYSIFSFRLISLLAGTSALYLFYKAAQKFTDNNLAAVLISTALAFDIQFIYASHFARQEIILILILLITLYYYLYKYDSKEQAIRQDIVMALLLSTGIGIHPNSFVITLPFIFIYTYRLLWTEEITLRSYLAFGGTLGGIALFFVALSFTFDPNFLTHYLNYGDKLGVLSSFLTKIDRLDYFYRKLYHGVSGTYYTPPIKFQFITFALTLLFSLRYKNGKDKKVVTLLLMLLGINAGYVLIGRYNQTGIIFIFPLCYLLLLRITTRLKKRTGWILISVLIAVLSFNTVFTLMADSHHNYDNYLEQIGKAVARDDRVLANLNSEYYFENGKLHDYRNLAHLEENNMTFSEYINKNNIEYIIYPEEMDFIYNTRPVWNTLYGNLYPYYREMKDYLNEECKLVHEFTNRGYGMRIARYVGEKEWKVRIYRTNNALKEP